LQNLYGGLRYETDHRRSGQDRQHPRLFTLGARYEF